MSGIRVAEVDVAAILQQHGFREGILMEMCDSLSVSFACLVVNSNDL